MADWKFAEEHTSAVEDTLSPAAIAEVQGNVASLQGSVTDITEQLAEMRMMMSQVVRRTSSTGPGAASDGEGESRGGLHTVAGAETGGALFTTRNMSMKRDSSAMDQPM